MDSVDGVKSSNVENLYLVARKGRESLGIFPVEILPLKSERRRT
jgi:hypothetical protein